MNMCLTRTLIMGCANKNVQKDLDKFVRVGSANYPSRFEGATGLILSYEKDEEREKKLERKEFFRNKNRNNNKDRNKENKYIEENEAGNGIDSNKD